MPIWDLLKQRGQASEAMRQSATLTTAYLLEQNRKFEAFMRARIAKLEGRVAGQQARVTARAEQETGGDWEPGEEEASLAAQAGVRDAIPQVSIEPLAALDEDDWDEPPVEANEPPDRLAELKSSPPTLEDVEAPDRDKAEEQIPGEQAGAGATPPAEAEEPPGWQAVLVGPSLAAAPKAEAQPGASEAVREIPGEEAGARGPLEAEPVAAGRPDPGEETGEVQSGESGAEGSRDPGEGTDPLQEEERPALAGMVPAWMSGLEDDKDETVGPGEGAAGPDSPPTGQPVTAAPPQISLPPDEGEEDDGGVDLGDRDDALSAGPLDDFA
jgi:hypothetical protein